MKKYVIILFDGMADYPNESGATPMSDALKPNVDKLAALGEVGLVSTVPEGMKPGSDVANLSVLGYDPAIYYSGRSPLEALSMGVEMGPDDVSYRCNLVTLGDDPRFENKIMVDYSAGEIPTERAHELIAYLNERLPLGALELYPGVSYRHCLIRRNGNLGMELTPPHDISDRRIGDFLPRGEYAGEFIALMKESYKILTSHPLYSSSARTANCIWLWGEGRKPLLRDFYGLHGMFGAVISAVDLVKGIGKAAGMDVPAVPGATGTISTNFAGKADAAIAALKNHDFVYIHLEAPDECGHQGNYADKVRAIQLIDRKIVAPVVRYLRGSGEPFSVAVLPDHATPVSLKTHVADPVPYLIYDSQNEKIGPKTFNEKSAAKTGLNLESGVAFLKRFLG